MRLGDLGQGPPTPGGAALLLLMACAVPPGLLFALGILASGWGEGDMTLVAFGLLALAAFVGLTVLLGRALLAAHAALRRAPYVRALGGARRCAYCHDDLIAAKAAGCAGCGAAYHADCLDEAGGRCPALGCRSRPRSTTAPARVA